MMPEYKLLETIYLYKIIKANINSLYLLIINIISFIESQYITKTEILRIEYRNNIKYNRLDGPALIRIDTSTGEKLGERFFIDDKEYDEFQYEIVKASKTFEEKV